MLSIQYWLNSMSQVCRVRAGPKPTPTQYMLTNSTLNFLKPKVPLVSTKITQIIGICLGGVQTSRTKATWLFQNFCYFSPFSSESVWDCKCIYVVVGAYLCMCVFQHFTSFTNAYHFADVVVVVVVQNLIMVEYFFAFVSVFNFFELVFSLFYRCIYYIV